MPDVLVLEVSEPNAVEIYGCVGRQLGIDGSFDPDKCPAPMLSHVAGESGDKLVVVVDVWESRPAPEEFMQAQLGPALHEAKAPTPTGVEWFSSVGEMHRH
jgi:hypothetical protein